MRPPIAGYLRGLHQTRLRQTAPYLGNLWREGTARPAEGQSSQPADEGWP